MKACLGTLGGRVQTGFKGWADGEPSTPVTYNLHACHEFSLNSYKHDKASSEQPSEFIRSLTGLVTWLKGLVMSLVWSLLE